MVPIPGHGRTGKALHSPQPPGPSSQASGLKFLAAAGVVAARLAGWCHRGVSETQRACLLTEPRSPPILASLEKGAHLQSFTCLVELGPNRIEDPAFAVLLLQGVHGHAGKVDGLLNLPGSKEDAHCHTGGSEMEIHLVRDTANVDCAGPSTDMSLTLGEENAHVLKEDYFVSGHEGHAECAQPSAALGSPPLAPYPSLSGWRSDCQFDPLGRG